MSLIIENLYLSNIKTSKNYQFFKKQKVTHVLIAAKNLKMIFKEINYKRLQLDDNPKQNIAKFFVESIKFIHDAISSSNKVLVHCLGGKSRSVTIVTAYVMLKQNTSFEKAFGFVKSIHRHANPNPGFIEQLQMFEKCVCDYYVQVSSNFKEDFDYKLLEKLIEENIEWTTSKKRNEILIKKKISPLELINKTLDPKEDVKETISLKVLEKVSTLS